MSLEDHIANTMKTMLDYQDEEHERVLADIKRERDQACGYAARLAEIERLLGKPVREQVRFSRREVLDAAERALAVASGGGGVVPLRVLVEWALRGRGWTQNDGNWWRHTRVLDGWHISQAFAKQIEREEAGGVPAAETSDG